MMGRYYGGSGSMMGGGYGWMLASAGYRWMFGGVGAPAWMRGAQLAATMMGTSTDMGQVMGRLWANAPGPRVSSVQAAALGRQVPVGNTISMSAITITFTSSTVRFAAVANWQHFLRQPQSFLRHLLDQLPTCDRSSNVRGARTWEC